MPRKLAAARQKLEAEQTLAKQGAAKLDAAQSRGRSRRWSAEKQAWRRSAPRCSGAGPAGGGIRGAAEAHRRGRGDGQGRKGAAGKGPGRLRATGETAGGQGGETGARTDGAIRSRAHDAGAAGAGRWPNNRPRCRRRRRGSILQARTWHGTAHNGNRCSRPGRSAPGAGRPAQCFAAELDAEKTQAAQTAAKAEAEQREARQALGARKGQRGGRAGRVADGSDRLPRSQGRSRSASPRRMQRPGPKRPGWKRRRPISNSRSSCSGPRRETGGRNRRAV